MYLNIHSNWLLAFKPMLVLGFVSKCFWKSFRMSFEVQKRKHFLNSFSLTNATKWKQKLIRRVLWRKWKLVKNYFFIFIFKTILNIYFHKHNSLFSYSQTNIAKNITKQNFKNNLSIICKVFSFVFHTKNKIILKTKKNNTNNTIVEF